MLKGVCPVWGRLLRNLLLKGSKALHFQTIADEMPRGCPVEPDGICPHGRKRRA